ncbi:hypothetical protein D0Z06_07240 [Geodermatophilus marinus]|nr:hypothetical protein D0Z06_07240 [Geodermatophilus sp. LHW52908]
MEPDAIIDGDGTAIASRRAGDGRAPLPSVPRIPALVRLAGAGPVLAASAFALTAVAAAKVAQLAGRMAWQAAVGDVPRQPVPGQVEVTWTRIEIRVLR